MTGRVRQWTVVTDRGAFAVYAPTAAAAKALVPRDRRIVEVRPRGYTPPPRREKA